MRRKVTFKTDSLRVVKEKIEAFHTLFGTDPTIYVRGNVDCKDYGLVRLPNRRVVSRIGRTYFRSVIDGELEDKLMPTTDSYGGMREEATEWTLVADL